MNKPTLEERLQQLEDKEAIRDLMARYSFAINKGWNGKQVHVDATDFSMHSFTNPVIDIEGDKATGNWLLWIGSSRNGGTPNEVFMSEDVTYVRTSEGWRIKMVDIRFGMMLLPS